TFLEDLSYYFREGRQSRDLVELSWLAAQLEMSERELVKALSLPEIIECLPVDLMDLIEQAEEILSDVELSWLPAQLEMSESELVEALSLPEVMEELS